MLISTSLIALALLLPRAASAQASQFDLSWTSPNDLRPPVSQFQWRVAQQVSGSPQNTSYLSRANDRGSQSQLGYGTVMRAANPGQYRMRRQAVRQNLPGRLLPPVSTSSIDLNICEDSGGFSGSGGSAGSGSGGGNGGPDTPPALPPGWAGVMCHGIYAGAIPPGGTVEAFWRGEYGFAGDAEQQAALRREGQWLFENGQVGQ